MKYPVDGIKFGMANYLEMETILMIDIPMTGRVTQEQLPRDAAVAHICAEPYLCREAHGCARAVRMVASGILPLTTLVRTCTSYSRVS